MGESTNPRATLRFDRRIRLRGATITSDAGLEPVASWMMPSETASECLQESRRS